MYYTDDFCCVYQTWYFPWTHDFTEVTRIDLLNHISIRLEVFNNILMIHFLWRAWLQEYWNTIFNQIEFKKL